MVSRSGSAVVVSGQLPRGVLRQPRDPRPDRRDRRWRTIAGGSRPYVEAIIAPMRDRIRLQTPVRRIERHARSGRDRPGRRIAGLRRGRDRDPRRPGAGDAGRPLTEPSASCWAPSPTRRNEAVLHTDERLMPRRRRAWASWNFHLVDEPVGRDHRHLPHEPPPGAFRRPGVLPDPEPHRGDRSRQGDSEDRLLASGLHRGRNRRAGSPWEISGRDRIRYCGAYWRWGFHEDGVWSALRVCEPLAQDLPAPPVVEPVGIAACDSAIYEGWVSHRRFGAVRHSFRYRVFMTLLDLDELPELFDRTPSARPAAPPRSAAAARTTSAIPTCRSPSPPASSSQAHRHRAAGPGALLANPRYLGRRLQPRQLLLPPRSGRGDESTQ